MLDKRIVIASNSTRFPIYSLRYSLFTMRGLAVERATSPYMHAAIGVRSWRRVLCIGCLKDLKRSAGRFIVYVKGSRERAPAAFCCASLGS